MNLKGVKQGTSSLVLVFLISLNAQALLGREGGNGGDIQCDAEIKRIALSIKKWIQRRGPEVGELDLSSSRDPDTQLPYTATKYDVEMLKLLNMPLDSDCVVGKNAEDPVVVDNSTKICKTSVDSDMIHMTCDRNLLLGLDPDFQIEQIHHEFATNIPGLEPDDGPISSYKISIQLSAFTADRITRELVVMPKSKTNATDPIPSGKLRVDVFEMTGGNLSDQFYNGRFIGLDPSPLSHRFFYDVGNLGYTEYVWLKPKESFNGIAEHKHQFFTEDVSQIIPYFSEALRGGQFSRNDIPLQVTLAQRAPGVAGAGPYIMPVLFAHPLASVSFTLGEALYKGPLELELIDPVTGATAKVRVSYHENEAAP